MKQTDRDKSPISTSNFWDVRDRIETTDGDWFHADTKYAPSVMESHAEDHHHNGNREHADSDARGRRSTRVLLIHGLESNSNSSLSQQIAMACHRQDMTVTCLNFRSCSMDESGNTLPNKLPGGYHLGFTYDLKYYLELNKNKNEDIFLVGFSLGANVVLKALGELGVKALQDYGIRGAAVACAPFEQETNARALARPGINRLIYTNSLLKSLKRKAVDQWKQFGANQVAGSYPSSTGDSSQTNNGDILATNMTDISALAVQEYEKSTLDRLFEGMQDAGQFVSRTWNEWDSKFQDTREGFVRGVSELTESVEKAVQASKTFVSTPALPSTGQSTSSGTKNFNHVSPTSLAFVGHSRQAELSNLPVLNAQNVQNVGIQVWKSVTSGYSELQPDVVPQTVLSAAVMGTILAFSSGIDATDHSMEIALMAGFASAFSATRKGPIGNTFRALGTLGVSTCVFVWEFWNQTRAFREERVASAAKALLSAAAAATSKHTDEAAVSKDNPQSQSQSGNALLDLPRALSAETITEFDDAFIAPIYGFDDCWDYYRKTSSVYFLEDIAVPTLVINAEDDPFFDSSVNPFDKTVEGGGRAPVKLIRTKSGGHLGFCFQQVDEKNIERIHNASDGVSWMPSELARFVKHIRGRRKSKRALLQHLLPVEQLYP